MSPPPWASAGAAPTAHSSSIIAMAGILSSPASLRPDRPKCPSSPVHRYVCLDGLERNCELLCKIAIRIHGRRSVKITQQIDLIVARQLEHGLVKRDHQR